MRFWQNIKCFYEFISVWTAFCTEQKGTFLQRMNSEERQAFQEREIIFEYELTVDANKISFQICKGLFLCKL